MPAINSSLKSDKKPLLLFYFFFQLSLIFLLNAAFPFRWRSLLFQGWTQGMENIPDISALCETDYIAVVLDKQLWDTFQ